MLCNFFTNHLTEIYFIYGLSFFIMGFAIYLQVRRNSTFTMAKSLWLLAIFGFLHGISEWLFFYIPFRGPVAGMSWVFTLEILEMNLIAISFAFLLLFGIHLLDNALENVNLRHLFYLAIAAVVAWFLYFTVYRIIIIGENVNYWFTIGDIFGRHFFGLPGGILSAYAVLCQREQVKMLGGTPALFSINALAFGFIAYAVVAGAIVPPAPIFLAHVINTETFFQLTCIPGPVFRTVACIIITISMLRVLKLFQDENTALIEKMASENAALLERERFKRDLHDGIIQSLYAAGLNAKEAEYNLDNNCYEEAEEKVNDVMEKIDEIIKDVRMYIQDLKRAEVAGLSVTQIVGAVKEKFIPRLEINIDNNLGSAVSLSSTAKIHIYHILMELLTNTIKHAGANKVNIKLRRQENNFIIAVQDDGHGFETGALAEEEAQDGKTKIGLLNIKQRIESVQGKFKLDSQKGKGTTITMEIPVERG